jgi:hypothetical protein
MFNAQCSIFKGAFVIDRSWPRAALLLLNFRCVAAGNFTQRTLSCIAMPQTHKDAKVATQRGCLYRERSVLILLKAI